MVFWEGKRADRYAWMGWALLFAVSSAILISGSSRSVVPAYHLAAVNWLRGLDLYDGSGVGGFVYFPQAAILYMPFAFLPPITGELLWRLANVASFAWGIRDFSGLAGKQSPYVFAIVSLLAIPLAWDCARNGQSTLMMTGFMMIAVVAWTQFRWWSTALWLSLAIAVKPLAVVLVLLLMAIDRRLSWRILAGAGVLFLAPFLMQHPSYVIKQYLLFLQNSATAAHVAVVGHGWTSPFTALRVAGVDVPEGIQMAIRLTAAAATLALSFRTTRSPEHERSAVYIYSLAALYIILFSPRTENNTYAMIGPVFGIFAVGAFTTGNRREGVFLAALCGLLTASRPVQLLIAPGAEKVWLSPLLAAIIAVYVVAQLYTSARPQPAASHSILGR